MKLISKTLKFPYISHEKEEIVEKTLKDYLCYIGKNNLFNHMSYILKEMIANANKANLKRIFFQHNELEIKSNMHYDQGMKKFKDEINNYYTKYNNEAERLGYYVKIDFIVEKKVFKLIVTNNSVILPPELEKFQEKIKNARKYHSMEDVITQAFDTSEGAGFGIIICVLLLKKIGMDENSFKISRNEKTTETEVEILFSLVNRKDEEHIAEAVKRVIEEIPKFPEHIMKLQKILSDPNSNFEDLAYIINKDPALIADLLRLANSCMYMLPKPIKTIEDAVRQIGYKGVKSLILTSSAQKLLSEKYSINEIRIIIEHSSEVAFYSYELSKKLNLRDIIEEVFTAAILHDIGKLIINSLKPNMIENIIKICNKKGISSDILENLTDGFNHSLIGAKLAEKWNFPPSIIEAIKFHHTPYDCTDQHKDIIYIIYLANIFYYYKREEYSYSNISFEILKHFKLTDEKEFDKIFKNISDKFEKRKDSKDKE